MGWVGVLSITTQPPVVESHQSVKKEEMVSLDIWDKVVVINCGGLSGEQGTGVVMDWGWVVTAGHVVKDCPVGSNATARWIKRDGNDQIILKEKQVEVLSKSDKYDLALLNNVDIKGFPVGQYEAGNAVIYGYPQTIQSQVPVVIKPENTRIKLTQTNPGQKKIVGGASGSIVMQNDKLVGITVTTILESNGTQGYAVQSSDIDNFIQSYKKEKGL